MVLQNYIILNEGTPARMHFINHSIQAREITDPLTGRPKTARALVFEVDELNEQVISAHYSTLSEKHALQFQPYLDRNRYINFTFTVTQIGKGFGREYTLKVEPRK